MDRAEYEALARRVELGDPLDVLERFLYERERRRRAEPPNALEQAAQARRVNPLLQTPPTGA